MRQLDATRSIVAITLAAGVLVACSTGQGAPAPAAPSSSAEPGDEAEPAGENPRMAAHFRQAVDMREAVSAGDLAAAQDAAKALVGQLEGGGEDERAVAGAAGGVVGASDLGGAALAVAETAAACGQCHARQRLELSFPELPDPGGEASGAAAHMQRHQWASEQLWRGLVGNYETAWSRGGAGFAESPLHAAELEESAQATVSAEVKALAARVHELGAQAREATEIGARTQIYGELLGTCAGCHAGAAG